MVSVHTIHMRGTPKKDNYFMQGRPLVVQVSPLAECSRSPSVSGYQLALLSEAALGFSEFFWRLFQCLCPFHDGWLPSAPAHAALSAQQFLTTITACPPCPSLPIHPIIPRLFCFHRWKVLKRKCFCRCGRRETKNGRSINRHQNRWAHRLFGAVEKRLDRCIASNGEYFEGDWSLNM